MSRASRALLGAAILVHLLMLVSWRTGTLNPLFFDATVTHGVRGWDFYALYQAGRNVLTGHSAYEGAADRIDMVIPGGTYTPFRYLPVSAYTAGVLLNGVPPRWAYRLWVAFTEGVLLACIALTWRTTPGCACGWTSSLRLENRLGASLLYIDCLEVAYVSDREVLRDRLLRAPVSRKGER